MKKDRFWKILWLLFSAAVLACTLGSTSLFFAHIGNIDTAAVGVDYSPDKDPYETSLRKATPTIGDGYLYKDALPIGLSSWNWDATLDPRSTAQVYEGTAALKVIFTNQWGGFGISGFTLSTAAYQTLSLSVYTDSNVGDMYLELYDSKGNSLGQQSLGWYAPGGALVPGQWQTILIPVQNLLGSSTSATVTAFSLNTTNAGTAYIDNIQFNNAPSAHAPWVYRVPAGYVAPPFNPFATSTPVSLPFGLVFSPYPLNPSPYPDDRWYSPRGFFQQAYDGFRLGPQKGGNTDALAYFRGGKEWNDYEVTSTVNFGSAAVFSLLLRMQDEQNYVSCSFSYSGNTIQMYSIVGGVSTLVTQSDKLHYSDWTGGSTDAGAVVQGDTLICTLGGKQILSQEITTMPRQGTVGMEAWDKDDSTTAHQVVAFQVNPLAGE